ncbi:MAG: EamA-like transporter family protein [Firmicutes bacterium ADurb.Bin182]|nr:MAG: EamA-like transporter family protein [Firmicutes bacterium ADurb.Bin182]
MKRKTKTILANLMMLTAAAVWGMSFVVMKTTLNVIPANTVLALRFTAGALGLCYTLFKHRLTLKKAGAGALVGAVLYAAFALQTFGLKYTTASKNAFITVVYVVLVPVFYWFVKKDRPSLRIACSALLCFFGIGLLTLTDAFTVGLGDALTLVSGGLYALHIVLVGLYEEKCDVVFLTFLQFFFAAVYSWGAALLTEPLPVTIPSGSWPSLAYLCLLSTLLGFTFQNIGIKYSEPSVAALILSTESMFACLFSVVLLGDELTLRMWAGALCIIVSLVWSQTRSKSRKDTGAPCVNEDPHSLPSSEEV